MYNKEELRQSIINYRSNNRLSQINLAKQIKINVKTLQKIERLIYVRETIAIAVIKYIQQ